MGQSLPRLFWISWGPTSGEEPTWQDSLWSCVASDFLADSILGSLPCPLPFRASFCPPRISPARVPWSARALGWQGWGAGGAADAPEPGTLRFSGTSRAWGGARREGSLGKRSAQNWETTGEFYLLWQQSINPEETYPFSISQGNKLQPPASIFSLFSTAKPTFGSSRSCPLGVTIFSELGRFRSFSAQPSRLGPWELLFVLFLWPWPG